MRQGVAMPEGGVKVSFGGETQNTVMRRLPPWENVFHGLPGHKGTGKPLHVLIVTVDKMKCGVPHIIWGEKGDEKKLFQTGERRGRPIPTLAKKSIKKEHPNPGSATGSEGPCTLEEKTTAGIYQLGAKNSPALRTNVRSPTPPPFKNPKKSTNGKRKPSVTQPGKETEKLTHPSAQTPNQNPKTRPPYASNKKRKKVTILGPHGTAKPLSTKEKEKSSNHKIPYL